MKLAIEQRDKAVLHLAQNNQLISDLYRKCYKNIGRGALMLYTNIVVDGIHPDELDYRTKNEARELFDNPKSKSELSQLISNYDPKNEGILILVSDTERYATWFITFKLEEEIGNIVKHDFEK